MGDSDFKDLNMDDKMGIVRFAGTRTESRPRRGCKDKPPTGVGGSFDVVRRKKHFRKMC